MTHRRSFELLTIVFLGALALAHPAAAAPDWQLAEDLKEALRVHALGRGVEVQAAMTAATNRLRSLPPGKRGELARETLATAQKVGDAAAAEVVRLILEDEGLWLYWHALDSDGGPRSERLDDILACLRLARNERRETPFARGTCLKDKGDNAAALPNLQLAVTREPNNARAKFALARVQWRLGDHERPLALALAGLRKSWLRDGVEIVTACVRQRARAGMPARDLAACVGWLASAPAGGGPASLFARLKAEIHMGSGELPEALAALKDASAADRAWLMGGLVRQARALAERGPGERTRVLATLAPFLRGGIDVPAPLLRLAGDLHLAAGDRVEALRSYAASISDGAGEGVMLARRFRERAGASELASAPGSVMELLAGGLVSRTTGGPAALPASERSAQLAREVLASREGAKGTELVDAAIGAVMEPKAGPEPVAQNNQAGAKAPPPSLLTRLRVIGKIDERRFPATQRALIIGALAGDVTGTLERMDGLALLSWQIVDPMDARRAEAPVAGPAGLAGMVARNTAPLSASMLPSALGFLMRARKDVASEQSSEDQRLAAVIEVARLETPEEPLTHDPIALDLDGNGRVDLTHDAKEAALFDLAGYGRKQTIQWLARGRDGWLCEDTDGDGRISSGHELFGTAGGYTDGFEKLALRDANHDGALRGSELAGLSIWQDNNADAVTDPGELAPATEHGLEAISIPRFGLRAVVILHGKRRLCEEVWPQVLDQAAGAGGDLDLEGI